MSDKKFIEEEILTPEDFLKLNQILAVTYQAVNTAREKLPLNIQRLVASATATSDLRDGENERDRILIEITFILEYKPSEPDNVTVGEMLSGADILTTNIDPHEFEISIHDTRTFYVECLSENFAELVEQKFTKTVKDFIMEYCNFLYKVADSLHEILNP